MSHETHRSLENSRRRVVLRRTDDTVILYARSGRVVTLCWMDLALAGMALRPDTALDGEAVIWCDGRLDFGAAQSRAASSVTRCPLTGRPAPGLVRLLGPRAAPRPGHRRHPGNCAPGSRTPPGR
ncbi:hypothetical protein [Streptomyces sp. NBC_00353]|uniref:hypothetical protein n=1 Tax=unclassified Streptomyces TaxID=2593676 RepID=UPI002E2658A9